MNKKIRLRNISEIGVSGIVNVLECTALCEAFIKNSYISAPSVKVVSSCTLSKELHCASDQMLSFARLVRVAYF